MGLLNNLIIMHVTRRSSNTMLSPPHGQGARKHVTRRASSTMLSPPHGQGATIRQFGPTQRATLSTQRTTVKWLLLLGLVTLAVAKPNPTIERMKRASVQMHTYQRRTLVSRADAAARRRLANESQTATFSRRRRLSRKCGYRFCRKQTDSPSGFCTRKIGRTTYRICQEWENIMRLPQPEKDGIKIPTSKADSAYRCTKKEGSRRCTRKVYPPDWFNQTKDGEAILCFEHCDL